MKKEIVLSPEAAKMLAYSVLIGPNCVPIEPSILEHLINAQTDLPILALSTLRYGPASFLITYAVTHKKNYLGVNEVAEAYCLDHINMVRSTELIFDEKGVSDPYFDDLVQRDFVLSSQEKKSYLFSCLGKIGQIVGTAGDFSRVRVGRVLLENVYNPGSNKGSVFVHFAMVLAPISQELGNKISLEQGENPWYQALLTSLDEAVIDYRDYLGHNLSLYTKAQLEKLKR